MNSGPRLTRKRDITETKRREAALRESEERLRLAMNNVASGVYILDLNGLVTYVNPAAETMFGWTNAELLGRKMHDVTHYKHPDGSPFPASDCPGLEVLHKGVELREHEDMFIRKDGSFLPVVYSASPLKSEGKTVGIVVGFRDDTPRREAERTVRESEERFRLIANTAPVMIWMSDVEKQITYLNQTWLDFTGLSLDAALGHRWIQVLHPDEVDRCRDAYVTAFDQREPFQVEHRLRRHDGEYQWAVTAGVPHYNVDGSFAGYIGTAIDVTERKLAQDVLSTVNQRLIAAQEDERALVARELHDDINQRLTMIGWRLDGLVQEPAPSAETLRQKIHATREEVATLVNDVQALSHRLHSPRLDYLGIEAAAASLCREVSGDVSVSFHAGNVPADVPQRISVCLYRVLQEALQNAIKHSGARHVEVSLVCGADQIELTVHDSGAGFDPEDALRRRGLGLTSMKERLKAADGQLSIESKPHSGTTIRARVPLPSVTPELVAGATPRARTSSIYRVLVVDDYEPWRRNIESAIQASDRWQVVGEAADGVAAVEKAEVLRPDLILLDVGLPVLNGIEAARRILALDPDSRILFLSENGSWEVVEAALGTGGPGYVLKSDAGRDLLSAMEAVVEGQRFISRSLTGDGFDQTGPALTPAS